MKLAAIDIGSNAVRLLFTIVAEDDGEIKFHKISLIRMPVRLGVDSFKLGKISAEHREDLISTLTAYGLLIKVFGAQHYKACATAALREAENGEKVLEEARQASGLDVEIIDGSLEAELIHATHIAEDLDATKNYLYIDVGGGSTELTLFAGGRRLHSESFKIGTLRLLEEIVHEQEWLRLNSWIRENVWPHKPGAAIGTGGNINKIIKLTKVKGNRPLSVRKLNDTLNYLKDFTFEERVNKLGLRPDRADVIIPAAEIYLHVLRKAHITKVFVPKMGLADGMVRQLFEQHKNDFRPSELII